MKFEVDTVKLKTAGEQLVSLTNEYGAIIEEIFEKIAKMSDESGFWIGKTADYYRSQSMIDKNQYIQLENELLEESKILIIAAEAIESDIKTLMR